MLINMETMLVNSDNIKFIRYLGGKLQISILGGTTYEVEVDEEVFGNLKKGIIEDNSDFFEYEFDLINLSFISSLSESNDKTEISFTDTTKIEFDYQWETFKNEIVKKFE